MRVAHERTGADLFDPATYRLGVPHAELARRRREAPVAWVDEKPLVRHGDGGTAHVRGSGYWAVTRHATIAAVSRDRERFSSAARGAFLPDPLSPADLEQTRQLLINMDAPTHTRVRRAVAAPFKPAVVAELRQRLAAHARRLVERVRAAGEFDAVDDLCAQLPLHAIGELVGVPEHDRAQISVWSGALVGFDDPAFGDARVERYKRAFLEAHAYALELARERRRAARADLAGSLVAGPLARGELTEREFCGLFLLLVIAGNETTRHLLSGGVQALAEHPGQRDRLVADPRLVPQAVEELLRWVSPVLQFRRTALVDTTLDGQPVRAGDKVVLYYASANYDEAAFAHPTRLRLDRAPNPHLAFGIGPHFCLGAALARLEAAVLLEALRPHLPRLRIVGPVVRLQSNFVNGIVSMPARFAAGRTAGGHA